MSSYLVIANKYLIIQVWEIDSPYWCYVLVSVSIHSTHYIRAAQHMNKWAMTRSTWSHSYMRGKMSWKVANGAATLERGGEAQGHLDSQAQGLIDELLSF